MSSALLSSGIAARSLLLLSAWGVWHWGCFSQSRNGEPGAVFVPQQGYLHRFRSFVSVTAAVPAVLSSCSSTLGFLHAEGALCMPCCWTQWNLKAFTCLFPMLRNLCVNCICPTENWRYVGSHVDSSVVRSTGRSGKNWLFLNSSTEAEEFESWWCNLRELLASLLKIG